jgi:hypothetical protein
MNKEGEGNKKKTKKLFVKNKTKPLTCELNYSRRVTKFLANKKQTLYPNRNKNICWC